MIDTTERRLLGTLDRVELISLIRDLVRIDSVIRPDSGGTERGVVRYLASWLRDKLSVEPRIDEVSRVVRTWLPPWIPGARAPAFFWRGTRTW